MSDLFSLERRVALVTGANTGLGQAIAIALAKAGASIAAVSRRSCAETEAAVRAIGRPFHAIEADLSSTEPVSRIIQETVEHLGSLNILVNNAGTIRRAEALDFTESDWDAVVNVNLKSLFFLSQAAARHMLRAHRGGKIINIASMLSFQGGIRVAPYTASKSGVAGLTRLLANEWAGQALNVNAIAPGYFETDNTEALRNDPQRSKDILARIPAGRWGKPTDLGGAAVFLASSAADYVHGALIPVDGGWLAR
jgi:2-dehydro-3-deoxy-D-gluconate 5-dehydrogenase